MLVPKYYSDDYKNKIKWIEHVYVKYYMYILRNGNNIKSIISTSTKNSAAIAFCSGGISD